MRKLKTLLTASVLALAWFYASPAEAQYGDLYGSVMNEQGDALPGVAITLQGMGADRIATSDGQGAYRFLSLDPGTYSLAAKLDGFSMVEQPKVIVELSRNTTINFTLDSAIEDTITVTSETPLLDERQIAKGTNITALNLATIPSARDPWDVMNQAPGVLIDRVDVAGSESDQQRGSIAPGVQFSDNDWQMDGIQIGEMMFPGHSTTYYDAEQFESIEVSTGGPDVDRSTPGVVVNMVTKRGTNEFRGSARFLSSKDDGLGFLGQSESGFDCDDLAATQDCDSFEPNLINSIGQYGFEAGGPAITDRLWLWGSYGVSDIKLTRAGGDDEDTLLENTSVKLNAQLAANNSFVASWNNGDKKKFGRGAGPFRAPETTVDQRGPSAFWRFEDTHVFGSRLFLTGAYQKSDLGFQLKPRSGCLGPSCPMELEALWDTDGVFKQNWSNGRVRNPEEALKLDGSYFFNTGSTSHELKFGGRIRQSQGDSVFAWPGRSILHIAGENFGAAPGTVDFFGLYRAAADAPVDIEYASLWAQDTIAAGNWTINAGLRWDRQEGVNLPGTTGTSAAPEHLPSITFDQSIDDGFDWETVTPRLGVTRAFGADRDTLLRASFSQFPGALGWRQATWTSPIVPSFAYFLFIDIDNDTQWNGSEPYQFLFGVGYDEKNPGENLNTVDPNFDPELTSEATLGVEHSILPELVVGLTYTWRNVEDKTEIRELVRPFGTDGAGRPLTAADFVPTGDLSDILPDGSEVEVPIFGLESGLELNGFGHLANSTREVEYNGIALTLNKRLSNRWSARGFFNWGEGKWKVPQSYLDNSDPNDQIDRTFAEGEDDDGALFYEATGGRGGDYYMQSTWQWNLTGIYQVAPDAPWGFNLSANLYGREGFANVYNQLAAATGLPTDTKQRTVSLVGRDIDRFRIDDLTTVNLRVEKTFAANSNINFTFGLDLFNALNAGTVLNRNSSLDQPTGNWVGEVLGPRIWKLGVRISWK